MAWEQPDGTLVREELVRGSKNNVLVETLPTGKLGLPVSIVPAYKISELGERIPSAQPRHRTEYAWSPRHPYSPSLHPRLDEVQPLV